MTSLYKHRLILDLDETHGPIQATLELHTADGATVHRITTWTPGPFDTPVGVLQELIYEAATRYGIQEKLL